jgi:predicted kinase
MSGGRVIALMGLPGSGKSSLLAALALPLPVIDRDAIRAAMFPQPFDGRSEKDAAISAVWAALAARLKFGQQVVIDGMTFASQRNRDQVARIARAQSATALEVFLDVPPEVCAQRVAAQVGHPSPERNAALVYEVAARFEPVSPQALRLDGTQPMAELARQLAQRLQA